MNPSLRPLLLATVLAAATATATAPARAESLAGAFLAAQLASQNNDYVAAARYFAQALRFDPGNPDIAEQALVAFMGKGDMQSAIAMADLLDRSGEVSQLAELTLIAEQIKAGNHAEALDRFQRSPGFSPLLDGLLEAWLLLGTGDVDAALAAFDAMSGSDALNLFGQNHKALALASVGDFEGADKLFRGDDGGSLRIDRGSILAHAQVLLQLDRRDEALAIIDQALDGRTDAELEALRARIVAGETIAYDVLTTPSEGAAEVFFVIASALTGEENARLAMIYSRLGLFIAPGRVKAILQLAGLMVEQEQYQIASDLYDEVPHDHPMYYNAGIGRAEALFADGNEDGAVEVLKGLAKSHGHIPTVHITLGDTLRRLSRFEEASRAYEAAVELLGEPQPHQWFFYYARGITYERQGKWEQADADFRMALRLSPDQPHVLNYLGYSLVERRERLDEALAMIERASEQRPDDGYITDSVGWVYYRLGRFEDAVAPMERAVELTPLDPIINDHLGDVYWAVGRHREAEFQWRRALSFEPEEKDAERIRRKLAVGLDRVLAEEGEAPIQANAD